jgi:gluconate 5-dehydrogenase
MYGMVAPDFTVYDDFPDFLNPPHYGAAKAGIIQMTKYFASYLAPYGILVNAVSPGAFPSADVQKHTGFIAALGKKNPLKRIGQPDELKGVFVFLASNASTYVTGQNIAVDGGWTVI